MEMTTNHTEKRTFPVIQFIIFLFCGCGLFLAIENYDQLETAFEAYGIKHIGCQ